MKSKYSLIDLVIKKCLLFFCCFDVIDMFRRSVIVYMRFFSLFELGWVVWLLGFLFNIIIKINVEILLILVYI